MDIAQFSHSGVCLGENSDIFFLFPVGSIMQNLPESESEAKAESTKYWC